MEKIKYWWADDRKWFCILIDDGANKATVSLTPEEAYLLSMNAAPDRETLEELSDAAKHVQFVMFGTR